MKKMLHILSLIIVLVLVTLVITYFNHSTPKETRPSAGNEFTWPTENMKNIELDKEFELKIGESAAYEDMRLMVIKNLVPPMSKSDAYVKPGIQIVVEEKGTSQEINFHDGEENIKKLDNYTIQLIKRVPGTGTFRVSQN